MTWDERGGASNALKEQHVKREKETLKMLAWLSVELDQPELARIKGNEKILENKHAALTSRGNSVTFEQLASYDAAYAESQLSEAIKSIGLDRFIETVTPRLLSSRTARALLNWQEEHKVRDAKEKEDERFFLRQRIANLKEELIEAENELNILEQGV